MIFKGERVVPKLMNPNNQLLQEHLYRYKFAKEYCLGRVVDVGCGVGYGSELIAQNNPDITEWVGIDICQACIAYANHHYTYPSTTYYIDDALNPNLHKTYNTFDTVLCLQTVQYICDNQQLIENLYTLLNPKGVLIISTSLNISEYTPQTSSFHIHKHEIYEFLETLVPFNYVETYEQMDINIKPNTLNKNYCNIIAVCKK